MLGSFSNIIPIAPSGGFSDKTLTKVSLCYGRPSRIGVFLLWKIEYLDYCITVIETCYEENCHRECLRGSITMGMYLPNGWTWYITSMRSI